MKSSLIKPSLSANLLKIFACASMLIDHIGASVYLQYYLTHPTHKGYVFYYVLRYIGRPAFPIFCFFIAEGYSHIKDDPIRLRRYALRLAAFALISEIPFDLAFNHSVLEFSSQNVYFTLCLGLLSLISTEFIAGKLNKTGFLSDASVPIAAIASAAVFGLMAYFLQTDYDFLGVIVIEAAYLLRGKRPLQALTVCSLMLCLGKVEMTALIAVPLLICYSGQRGKQNKWVFYLFYPVHLLLLGILVRLFF